MATMKTKSSLQFLKRVLAVSSYIMVLAAITLAWNEFAGNLTNIPTIVIAIGGYLGPVFLVKTYDGMFETEHWDKFQKWWGGQCIHFHLAVTSTSLLVMTNITEAKEFAKRTVWIKED